MTPEQKRKRDLAAEAFAKTGEDIGACEQSFRVGYDQGFAEGRAEIERLTAELEQLQKAYEERGEAMRHTGDIVRSLYAPKNVKLNKENGKLKGEIQHLKAELAKPEGELHMNSDFNVEKLHMNSKGEPAKCELHKNDDVTQNSDINIVSRANPAAIPNGDNGGAKMPPLRRMQFNGHEYVHLQEVLESVDALKAERDQYREQCEKLAGALERYCREMCVSKYQVPGCRYDDFKKALAAYEALKAERDRLKCEGETWQGHAEANHALLMRTEDDRDRWREMCERLAGALEHYKHLAMPKDKISAIVETYPFAAVALAEYRAAVDSDQRRGR